MFSVQLAAHRQRSQSGDTDAATVPANLQPLERKTFTVTGVNDADADNETVISLTASGAD